MTPEELIIKKVENAILNEIDLTWDCFYEWLKAKDYHIYKHHNIFRNSKFIYSFDDMECADSGEIEETIKAIKEIDVFNFK
jgi:hypothetical protein